MAAAQRSVSQQHGVASASAANSGINNKRRHRSAMAAWQHGMSALAKTSA